MDNKICLLKNISEKLIEYILKNQNGFFWENDEGDVKYISCTKDFSIEYESVYHSITGKTSIGTEFWLDNILEMLWANYCEEIKTIDQYISKLIFEISSIAAAEMSKYEVFDTEAFKERLDDLWESDACKEYYEEVDKIEHGCYDVPAGGRLL